MVGRVGLDDVFAMGFAEWCEEGCDADLADTVDCIGVDMGGASDDAPTRVARV